VVEKTENIILITGSDGMLGSVLSSELTSYYPVIGTTLKDLDITDASQVKHVISDIRPFIVVHLAALTDVDYCEEAPELAYNVNARGAQNIAQASSAAKAILIYLSTDYIFDGAKDTPYTEDSAPSPISIYGQTKLEGERFIQEELNNFVIIRSSWLFGKGKVGFVEKILEQAKTKESIRVVADKFGSPTYVNDLASAINKLIDLIEQRKFIPERSALHITNSGFCSWVEYANKIIDLADIKGVTVTPITQEEFTFKAKRPRFSVLDNSRYNKLTGQPLRPWQQALEEYLLCFKN
jgi:dTDP-4-dehydrorhamnose reductase